MGGCTVGGVFGGSALPFPGPDVGGFYPPSFLPPIHTSGHHAQDMKGGISGQHPRQTPTELPAVVKLSMVQFRFQFRVLQSR